MTRRAVVLLMSTLVMGRSMAQTSAGFHDAVTAAWGGVRGTFAVAFEDLESGRQLLIDESEIFHAASTMKIAVMIEMYRQAARGMLSLDDSLMVRNEFRSIVDGTPFCLDPTDDSDADIYDSLGRPMRVRDLIERMIIVSSNLATNLLIERVGAANVTATASLLGASHLGVLRGVEDQKAYERGLNNTTTAMDLLTLLRAIGTGKAVDRASSGAMLEVLGRQRIRDKIPALLPPDVMVANKTGSFRTVQHDAGIITTPDGRRYVLVVLSKDLADDNAGRDAIARISRAVYDMFTGGR